MEALCIGGIEIQHIDDALGWIWLQNFALGNNGALCLRKNVSDRQILTTTFQNSLLCPVALLSGAQNWTIFMKALIIAIHREHHCLKQVLDALKTNDLTGYHLYVGFDSECTEVECALDAIDWIPKTIIKNAERYTQSLDPHDLIECAINDANDNFVCIESDVLLSPDALDLANWYFMLEKSEYLCLGLSDTKSDPNFPHEILETDSFNPSGWCFTRKIWEQRLKPNWTFDQRGWEWSIKTILDQNCLCRTLHPRLARAKHIGQNEGNSLSIEFNEPLFMQPQISEGQWKNYFVCRSHDKLPLITAVMVTGKDESRYFFANLAVECFLKQSYPKKELLIINHGARSVPIPDSTIKELRVARTESQTVGDLRNFGLDYAKGEFLICWDDDDWHNPERISMQYAAQKDDAAVFLRHQIRYNLKNDCAFVNTANEGLHGTILHSRNVPFRYPNLCRGEDTAFMNQFNKRIVVENSPSAYVRFYHGGNIWDAKHIMGRWADLSLKDLWEVNEPDLSVLKQVVPKYCSTQAEKL